MAYKPITRTFEDMGGFGPIFIKTVNGSIRNVHIPISSEAGEGNMEVYRRDKKYFVADMDLPLSQEQFDGLCNKIPTAMGKSRPMPEFNIRRTIPFKEGKITYTVVAEPYLTDSYFNISMLLPEEFTNPEQVVNGYHYYSAPGEEKDRMYEMAMAILDDSVRKLHIFRRVERYNDECVTKVCFEPRKDVPHEEMTRIIKEMLTDENGEGRASLSCKEYFASMLTYNTEITTQNLRNTFTGGNSNIVFHKFEELMTRIGIEIPMDTEITMDEECATRFGRGVSDFFDAIGRALYTPYDYAIGRHIRQARERERLRIRQEMLRFENWLRNDVGVPPNEKGYNQSCVVLVNPACEIKVRKGESPGKPGGNLELVGTPETEETS